MLLSSPFQHGVRSVLPNALGMLTFGTITSVASIGAGIPPAAAIAMGLIVYAGSAQLVAVQLLSVGAPLPVIAFAATIVNLRFVLYSIATAPILRERSRRWRWLQSYLLSDNGYGVMVIRQAGLPAADTTDFLMGASVAVWFWWSIGIVAGGVLGAGIPASWSLEFVVTLTFLVLGLATVRDRAMAAAYVAATVVAVLTWHWPFRLGLMTAALAGIASGMLVEAARRRP